MAYINLLDIIYPVGSIYISCSNQSPSSIVGGVWSAVSEKSYLMSAGSSISANTQGGANDITLTVEQMPQHQHTVSFSYGHDLGGNWSYTVYSRGDWSNAYPTSIQGGASPTPICPIITQFICGCAQLNKRVDVK